MLSKVTLWLIDNNYHVSVIARDSQKMEKLINQSTNKSKITPVLVDYSNDSALRNSIQSLIEKYESIDLVVAWIHSYAKNALNSITQVVSTSSKRDWKLYHILGSSSNWLFAILSGKHLHLTTYKGSSFNWACQGKHLTSPIETTKWSVS
ncbi:short-chain dehydrogenase [Cytobacillus sp. S13-E01]|nr:short-chain dehydrogenase [Cytobacillus sp. S13-E01]MDF0728987.1 short-chain dehydrogenase [Cytobacillus sp. S13-E01]